MDFALSANQQSIRDAVARCGEARCLPQLTAPATPEAVLRAIDAARTGKPQ